MKFSAKLQQHLQDNWPQDVEFWREQSREFNLLYQSKKLVLANMELSEAAAQAVHGLIDMELRLDILSMKDSVTFFAKSIAWLDNEGEVHANQHDWSRDIISISPFTCVKSIGPFTIPCWVPSLLLLSFKKSLQLFARKANNS